MPGPVIKLDKQFYQGNDAVTASRLLLGKYLCTCIDGVYTSGKIVETEAYMAPEDRGSHAWGGKRTPRTEVFFMEGGIAYVYLIYGMYQLFNVIVNVADVPQAVLIRAVEPAEGLEVMLQRRSLEQPLRRLTGGPGLLTTALGIGIGHNKLDLSGDTIWIEDRNEQLDGTAIIASARVGLNIDEPYRSIPWRFRIKDNKWTSPAK